MFVTHDPLGNPVDRRHPWNQHTNPQPQKRDFDGNYSWVMSPRWFDGTDHLALDTGGGPLARLWSTALSGLVNTDHLKATGTSVVIHLPKTALKPEVTLEWKIPQWSNTIERDRARTYFQAYAAAAALDFIEKALADVRAGKTKTWEPFEVPDEGIGCGFTEAVRGVLSHHMVIKGGKIANYHPYPPTPWNANPRDSLRHPRPLRGRGDRHARSSRRTTGSTSRASTSCGRCAASTRACRAGCTCTSARARCSRSCTRRPRWPIPSWPAEAGEPMPAPQNLRATGDRIEQLLDELAGDRRSARLRPGRGAAAAGHRALRGGPGPGRRAGRRASARSWSTRLVADELVASLLLVHGLHPEIRGAAGWRGPWPRSARSWPRTAAMSSCSASTRERGAVRLRLLGSCDGCPSSSVTLQMAVERAIVGGGARDRPIDVDAADSGGAVRRCRSPSAAKPVYEECPAEMADGVTRSAGRPAADPPAAAAAAEVPGRGALRAVRRAHRRRARPSRRPRGPQPDVRLPGLLPAVHLRRGGRRPLPGRARPVPAPSPTSQLSPGAVGRSLQIPVGVAFFFVNSSLGRVAAFYPGPGRRHRVRAAARHLGRGGRGQPGAGDAAARRRGLPGAGRPEREAERSASSCPIDACYELVGHLRRLWRGFDGGREAHDSIDAFFDRVRRRAR